MAFAQIDFFSEYLRMQCCMNVIIPQKINGYSVLSEKKATPPYPVLYLLHGTSENHADWMRFSSIERYAAKTGLLVVMPSTLRGWYTNQKLGYPFFDFFSKELPYIVKSFFNVSNKREDTFAAVFQWEAMVLLSLV
jgi:S-formylglutathione hydrolase FrmB